MNHFISIDEAEKDLLAAAAYVAERVGGSDDRADAVAVVVQRYLVRGEVDLAAELANSLDDPFMRDRLLIAVAAKCADLDDDEYALQLADAIEEQGLQSQAREMIALQKARKGEIKQFTGKDSAFEEPDAADVEALLPARTHGGAPGDGPAGLEVYNVFEELLSA